MIFSPYFISPILLALINLFWNLWSIFTDSHYCLLMGLYLFFGYWITMIFFSSHTFCLLFFVLLCRMISAPLFQFCQYLMISTATSVMIVLNIDNNFYSSKTCLAEKTLFHGKKFLGHFRCVTWVTQSIEQMDYWGRYLRTS